jgi:hypothetical protein
VSRMPEPGEAWPYYGPVGDPESEDPWERAQSQMPEGWHVEGQRWGNTVQATTKDGRSVVAYGGFDDLIAKVRVAEAVPLDT